MLLLILILFPVIKVASILSVLYYSSIELLPSVFAEHYTVSEEA